ncbi:hypothetical protein TRVA0_001S00672 [Trichomonascus vanleenenianus]|uniref:tyrosine/serine/threonine protein phosphatase PPS1 n=1 Tax=Trichomonascus vanleenenianus TaxID=2268995 RepID=UPI003ECAEC63
MITAKRSQLERLSFDKDDAVAVTTAPTNLRSNPFSHNVHTSSEAIKVKDKLDSFNDDEILSRPASTTPPASPPLQNDVGHPATLPFRKSLPPSPPPSYSPVPPGSRCPLQCEENVECWIDLGHKARVGVITASVLAAAVDTHYSSPLPDVDEIFPWLHGLHPKNDMQIWFFSPEFDSFESQNDRVAVTVSDPSRVTNVPGKARGLLVVKVGDENNECGTLVGSVRPSEILWRSEFDINEDYYALLLDDDNNDNDTHDEPMLIDDDDNSAKSNLTNGEMNNHNHRHHHHHHHHNHNNGCKPDFGGYSPQFLNLDPEYGVSLRNFHVQVAKWALISDLVVYAPDARDEMEAIAVARALSTAQLLLKRQHPHLPKYRTFYVKDSIEAIANVAPHIVAVPPKSEEVDEDALRLKNWDSNFLFHERVEMSMMSSATPVGPEHANVWLGNSVDFETYSEYFNKNEIAGDEALSVRNWITFVDCFDGAQLPPLNELDRYIQEANAALKDPSKVKSGEVKLSPLAIQFPCSGTFSCATLTDEIIALIISLCKLIYVRSQVEYNGNKAGTILYCNDGYSETSLLALLYLVYSTGVSASQAWLDLHLKHGRPFFCFYREVLVITELQGVLHRFSPALANSEFTLDRGIVTPPEVASRDSDRTPINSDNDSWFIRLAGAFPSKILPHMYLGSVAHAENPEMLVKLGIKRILSVGENLLWLKDAQDTVHTGSSVVYNKPYEGMTKVLHILGIHDDGKHSLIEALSVCLDFLDEGYRLNEPVLVHCRVGVSRSATVCIAEVMKRLGVGLPRAYLFVRVRRLNVIIQPNLRFMYELLKWEEMHRKNGEGWLREVDWHILSREIALVNRAYID